MTTWDWVTWWLFNTILPGWVFFSIFGAKAVCSMILGMHAVVMSRRMPVGMEREFARWLGWTMLANLMVYSVFFGIAFLLGAAILSPVGLVFFLPGLYVIIRAMVAWERLASRMVVDDGPARRKRGVA